MGDDDPDEDQQQVIAGLNTLTASGVACFILHGNRDFLIGPRFCAATGARLLHDPFILSLYGRRVLVMHGDADEVIDQSEGRKLFETAKEPKEGFWPHGAGHSNIFDLGGFDAARDFIERHL